MDSQDEIALVVRVRFQNDLAVYPATTLYVAILLANSTDPAFYVERVHLKIKIRGVEAVSLAEFG